MDQYFVITDGDIRMVAWGDQGQAMEATPVILCPPLIPPELVDDICTLIISKDPEGKIGQSLNEFIAAEMKAAENSPEMQGIAPGETFDDANISN